MDTSKITQASWEYLGMPKRRERMALYIRESDYRLATSITIDSQAKICREYGEKEGYLYDSTLEFREAISAVEVPYTEREKLLQMLDSAKKKLFDVLVVSEVRAIARRQVEVLVIYDMLLKYGIRLETVKEKFGEDAMSKAILSLRAMFVEIEVEQSKMRMLRGRADRMVIGGAPNGHPKPAYGYVFIDTDKEVKGAYEFNQAILYVDKHGTEWSEYTVVSLIFDLYKKGTSLHAICRMLNELQIPTPKKALKGVPHWQKGSLYSILTNPIYCGEVWANRFKSVKSETTGKPITTGRPREEWIRLPDAPAIVSRKEFDYIQQQFAIHKEESIRNNAKPKEELGLLRCGYIFCGVCGRRMQLSYPSTAEKQKGSKPAYLCEQSMGVIPGITKHRTHLHVLTFDLEVRKAICEALLHPSWVRERVAELREKPLPVVTPGDIANTITGIKKRMKNLYDLAEKATDDETMADIAERMNNLEKQKRAAELLLFNLDETTEEEALIEAELQKFEAWIAEVKPLLTDPNYQPTYEDLRLAIRILGIKATVWPTKGGYPHRWRIDLTVPAVKQKLGCDMSEPSLILPMIASSLCFSSEAC